jgi:hypothetical protein
VFCTVYFAPSRHDTARSNDRAIADARAAATRSYDAMVTRLGEAWRTPICDFAEPDQRSYPSEWQRHMRNEPPPGSTPDNDPYAAAGEEARIEATRGQAKRQAPRSVSAGPGSGASIREAEISVEKRRQAQHADFTARLENAWRSPPGGEKRDLSVAYLTPPPSERRPPESWGSAPLDPVKAVTVPAAANAAKGTSADPTNVELEADVEARRARQQAEFAQRLENGWKNRLTHL